MNIRRFDFNFCVELDKKLTVLRSVAHIYNNENLIRFLLVYPNDGVCFTMKVIYGEQALIALMSGDIATMNAIINRERANWMYQLYNHELDLISKGLLLTM